MEEKKKVDKKVVKNKVLTHIRAGLNYTETKKKLEEEDINYPGLSKTYYTWKQELFPSEKMDASLEQSRDKREGREGRRQTEKRKVAWSSKKQQEADKSKLAELINTGLYHGVFPLCKSQELRIEDVKEINLGGAIVGSVLYFFPDINLEHPIIVLTTRGILFFIRFRSICNKITEKVEEFKGKIPTRSLGGIKPDWKNRAVK